jgi:RNA polymerase sigma-70 factor (ECF subfamily)
MSPPRDERSDGELVAEFQRDPEGDRARSAAGELLGRYRGRAYLWCLRIIRDHDQALDLAQDALLSAYRALPRFDSRAQFSSWLFAIVRNRCLTALRPKSLSRDRDVEPDTLLTDGTDPLDRLALMQEEAEVLEAIRDGLEPIEQDALWLRAVERLPVEEITKVLGVSGASGARAVLQSARRKLKARLGDRWGDRR